MNNLLSYAQYKNAVIEARILEAQMIKNVETDIVEEGLFKNIQDKMNKKAEKMVTEALKEEIAAAKELETNIKESLKELEESFEKLKKEDKKKEDVVGKIEKIFADVNKMSFSIQRLLNDSDIDFASFKKHAILGTVVNFGVLFSPISTTFIIKKAYNYYLALIKRAIRRDLITLQLNFDQFENTIIRNAFSEEIDQEFQTKLNFYEKQIDEWAIAINSGKPHNGKKLSSDEKRVLSGLKKDYENTVKALKSEAAKKSSSKYGGMFNNMYDNTFTKNMNDMKTIMSDDASKKLEAMKTTMTKIAGQSQDLQSLSEFLIAASEECAVNSIEVINQNFLEMSAVFKLSNQKQLIDLISDSMNEEKEAAAKAKKEAEDKQNAEEEKNRAKEVVEKGQEVIDKINKLESKYSSDDAKADSVNHDFIKNNIYGKFDKNELEYLRAYLNSLQSHGGEDPLSDKHGDDNDLSKTVKNIVVRALSNNEDVKDSFASVLYDFYNCFYLNLQKNTTNVTKKGGGTKEIITNYSFIINDLDDNTKEKLANELQSMYDGLDYLLIFDKCITGLHTILQPDAIRPFILATVKDEFKKDANNSLIKDKNNSPIKTKTYKFKAVTIEDKENLDKYFKRIHEFIKDGYSNEQKSESSESSEESKEEKK